MVRYSIISKYSIIFFNNFFYLYRRENYKIYSTLIGLVFGILTILFFIPIPELKKLITNSFIVIQIIEVIGNIQYPSPLFGDDGRATKTLIFFFLTGLFLIIICLKKATILLIIILKYFFILFYIQFD